MNNFDFFLERCKDAKHFFCQIVLKDKTVIINENRLRWLLSEKQDEILVFIGTWQNNVKTGCGSGYDYLIITPYSIPNDEPYYGLHTMYMPEGKFAPFVFADKQFYILLEDGVAPEIIELMDLQYGCLSKNDEGYRELVKSDWEVSPPKARISRNEYMRTIIDTLSQMTVPDRKLFARVHKKILSALGNPNSSDVHAWDDVVLNVMKTVREGGGDDDIFAHLAPYGWRCEDEVMQTAYDKQRADTVEKLVALIREG